MLDNVTFGLRQLLVLRSTLGESVSSFLFQPLLTSSPLGDETVPKYAYSCGGNACLHSLTDIGLRELRFRYN